MRKNGVLVFLSVVVFLVAAFFSSCVSTKSTTYFNNLPDSQRIELSNIVPPQPTIQVNDLLEVKIGGENEKTVQYINQYLGTNTTEFIVDVDGNIELPRIGKVKVEGFTRDQAKDTITHVYGEYLQNPIVSIKFGNFRFAVLGEVRSPGYYAVTNEIINLFQAMAQAGDMTPYARRDNVKIIRDNFGKREIIKLDFNDKNILNSPYYYLNRNDIIYVESAGVKSTTENFSRTTALIATLTSIVAIFITIFRK